MSSITPIMYIKKNEDNLAKFLMFGISFNVVVENFSSLGKKDAINVQIVIVKKIPGKKHNPPSREAVTVCTFLLFGLSISLCVSVNNNILGMQYHTIQKHIKNAKMYNKKKFMIYFFWLDVYFNEL